jgi:hypothetical protein
MDGNERRPTDVHGCTGKVSHGNSHTLSTNGATAINFKLHIAKSPILSNRTSLIGA